MTLLEFRDKADVVLTEFWKELKAKQDAYFTKHGKYFQLLVSPEQKVIDGADSDFIVRHPSDVKALEDINVNFTSKIPFQIEVHEWGGGYDGIGYVVHVKVQVGEDTYCRSRNSKNEDTGWYKQTPITI